MKREIILTLMPNKESMFSLKNCEKSLMEIINPEITEYKIDFGNEKENRWLIFNLGLLFPCLYYDIASHRKKASIRLSKPIEKSNEKSFEKTIDYISKEGYELLPTYNIDEKKGFIISPVRNASQEVISYLRDYKAKLIEHKKFNAIHYPIDDTNQQDNIGINIIKENLQAMGNAGTVFIFEEYTSKGSVFDVGMLFSLYYYLDQKYAKDKKRKIKLINDAEIGKDKNNFYENFLLKWIQDINKE